MIPSSLELHKVSRQIELRYQDGSSFLLDAEFLRVHSPSAEVRGHHPSQAVLQYGKSNVAIDTLTAVGNYAIQIHFDDGHNSGIYSWEYLYKLANEQEALWANYLQQLEHAGLSRDPDIQVVKLIDPNN
jgi:DUF971 family protein